MLINFALQSLIEAHVPLDYHKYVSMVKDITKPYDEVLIIACCDFLQQNISIVNSIIYVEIR